MLKIRIVGLVACTKGGPKHVNFQHFGFFVDFKVDGTKMAMQILGI